MKQRLFLSAVLVALSGTVIGWANHFDKLLPADTRADLVVVAKSKRELTLYREGNALKTYTVALGRVPAGAKSRESDKKTPEGKYTIDYRKADSAYFRALHISYPNKADNEAAAKDGASAGGDIMIHGLRNGLGWIGKLHRILDWTLGCVAVSNEEMEELWRAVPDGTPVELRP
jgi:murein L,D-transpeptidase YafK